jgi:hypothetical protein
MDPAESKPRTYTLQRAGAVVFALVAILPLLLFFYTLYTLKALGRAEAQIGLGLALGLVLVGLYIFRMMLTRLAALLRAASATAPAPESLPAEPAAEFLLPGLGTIREAEPIRESDMLPAAVEQLRAVWQAEAEPLVGRRVSVSVRNAAEPVVGTLTQVTGDGLLLLDDGGAKVGVSYRRISAVEAVRPAGR